MSVSITDIALQIVIVPEELNDRFICFFRKQKTSTFLSFSSRNVISVRSINCLYNVASAVSIDSGIVRRVVE